MLVTAWDGLLLPTGSESAQFVPGGCLHRPRNTVPLVASPMKWPAAEWISAVTFPWLRVVGQGWAGCCAAVLNKELCYSGAFHWQMKNPPEKNMYQNNTAGKDPGQEV